MLHAQGVHKLWHTYHTTFAHVARGYVLLRRGKRISPTTRRRDNSERKRRGNRFLVHTLLSNIFSAIRPLVHEQRAGRKAF